MSVFCKGNASPGSPVSLRHVCSTPLTTFPRPSGDSSLFKLSEVLLDTLALRYPALLDVSMGSGEKGEVTAQFAVLPESGKLMWFL